MLLPVVDSSHFMTARIWILMLPTLVGCAPSLPPRARVSVVRDVYHGVPIDDPYRWLEDTRSAEARAWLRAQDRYARAILSNLPGRSALRQRIHALNDAGIAVTSLQRRAGRYFSLVLPPGAQSARLQVRDGPDGKDRVLADPDRLRAKDSHAAIDRFWPSPDGRLVAYALSRGGSEDATLYVVDATTGERLSERIDRARFAYPSWRADSRAFVYTRLRKPVPGAPPTDRFKHPQLYLHILGTDPESDRALFGSLATPELGVGDHVIPFGVLVPDSPYMLVEVNDGVSPEVELYLAPVEALSRPDPIGWKKTVSRADEVSAHALRGRDLYLMTHRGAPRYRVVRTDAGAANLATAQEVMAQSERVIMELGNAKDALYIRELDRGVSRMKRLPFDGGALESVPLPFDATASMTSAPTEQGALLVLESWTHSPVAYEYDPAGHTLRRTELVPPSPVSFAEIESQEVEARAGDGALVPLSIIHRRGLARDGARPTWLVGYGSYGISYEPYFDPTMLAWLERGGVYAVAHVRGGGERGEEWHQAGRLANKHNTALDFIACAEHLIAEKYTSPKQLVGVGKSAGGYLIGGAIARRPDLFAAAIARVPMSDALRNELTGGGPANVAEFGSVKSEVGFRALLAMSPYHQVKSRTAYPAVLLTAGFNDQRVPWWHPAKMTARLQAATTSGKPILLRVEFQAGHGQGSTKAQEESERADLWAFALSHLR
jgi:prolyl oligopeptidase